MLVVRSRLLSRIVKPSFASFPGYICHTMATEPRESPPAAKRQKLDLPPQDVVSPGTKQTGSNGTGVDGKTRQQNYMDRMGVKAVPDVPINKSTSTLNFRTGLFLAPMVRIGSLPNRLIALEHGADLVWGPEIVDRAVIGTQRIVHERSGLIEYVRADATGSKPADHTNSDRQIWSTHPIEKPYLIFQLGSASPALAYAAVQHVAQDVSGVDLNCGCPKPFSTHGGMGSNLLSTPDLLCDILVAMRKAAPSHVSVTCKIRLLPTQEETFALVRQIVQTGCVDAITVHCRTKEMRPREKALPERLKAVAEVIREESKGSVPVVVNGDCWDPDQAAAMMEITGTTAAMIARGAETNPTVFRRSGAPLSNLREAIPKWIRYIALLDNPFGNTKYCMNQLAIRPWLHKAGPSASKAEQSKPVSKPYVLPAATSAEAGVEAEQVEVVEEVPKKVANEIKQRMSRAKTPAEIASVFDIDFEAEKRRSQEEALAPLAKALASRQRQ